MREIVVNQNDSEQRVDKFLSKTFPSLPKSMMYKAIRNKKIKLNRKRCMISTRVQTGDVFQLFLPEEVLVQKENYTFLTAKNKLSVVYEDEHLLIVYKPSGTLVHSDIHTKDNTLVDQALYYLYQKGEYDPKISQSFTPAFIHRLDRNTEGLLLFAKDAMTLRTFHEALKEGYIQKYYLAEVEGDFTPSYVDAVYFYKKDEKRNRAILSLNKEEGSKRVEMEIWKKQGGQEKSVVEVLLHTGKSHQIRAILSKMSFPLVGDVKYGAKKNGKSSYQNLCAYRIVFQFPKDHYFYYLNQEKTEVQAPFIK